MAWLKSLTRVTVLLIVLTREWGGLFLGGFSGIVGPYLGNPGLSLDRHPTLIRGASGVDCFREVRGPMLCLPHYPTEPSYEQLLQVLPRPLFPILLELVAAY